MELCRKPLVTLTTRSFLGVAACVETVKAQSRPNKPAMALRKELFLISSTFDGMMFTRFFTDSIEWDTLHLA